MRIGIQWLPLLPNRCGPTSIRAEWYRLIGTRMIREDMAIESEAAPQNAGGRYYIDWSCIYCALCVDTAPEIFDVIEEIGQAYVKRQPAGAAEVLLAEEALEWCPLDSIGRREEAEA
jgi:ferredoxin